MWIATASGLNRFDGSRLITFHSNGSGNSLPAEDISELARLHNQRMAVLTSGTHIIDMRTGTAHNIFVPYHNLNYQFKFNMAVAALSDDDNNLYLVTRSGFYHFDKKRQLVFRFDYYSEKQVPVTHFFFGGELLELDENRLLLFAGRGPYVYEKSTRKFYRMRKGDCPELAGEIGLKQYKRFFQPARGRFLIYRPGSDTLVYVDAIKGLQVNCALPNKPHPTLFHFRTKLFVQNDTTWYLTGHNSGFFKLRFFPATNTLTFHPQQYFSEYRCTGMLWDNKGDLWVTTNKGVFHENRAKAAVKSVSLPATVIDSFPGVHLDDVAVLDSRLYVASKNAGIFIFDKETLKPQGCIRFGNNDKWNDIRGVTAAGNSTLFITGLGPPRLLHTATGSWKVLNPPFWNQQHHWSPGVYKGKDGTMWFSGKHVYNFNPASGKHAMIPTYDRLLEVPNIIRDDNAGNIWLASHGLARYNPRVRRYDLYLDTLPFITMPDKQVNAMVIDRQDRVWFSNVNNGLSYYDQRSRSFRHFTRTHGLPDNNIAALEVVNNWVWVATYSGLACVNLETFQILSFGKEDGFPDEPIMKGARFFFDEATGQLYIGFSKTVVCFNPELLMRRKPPPRVFIESLNISGKEINFLPGQTIATCWKKNDLNITIGSINFRDGSVQQFAYRIVGETDSSWIDLQRQPNLSISNLAPGDYTIQLKVFAADNRWPPQITELKLSVAPPWWQRRWFLVLAWAFLVGAVYLFFRWRIALVARKEQVKTQLEKLKADDYKNQVELEQISNYFSTSLADKKTEDEVLWDVAANLIGRMKYEECIIYGWNEDKTRMLQKAAYGPKGKTGAIAKNDFEVLPGQGIVGHVIASLQPELVHDTRNDPRYRVDDAVRLSEVSVPIIHDNELLGVIDSENSKPNFFSERDIKILTTIATLIGNKLKQLESQRSLEVKQRELAGINEQLAEARLNALQSQMNPHFVFNALNSIKLMILEGQNKKASRYLSKFASMIRMTLEHSRETFTTVDKNIAYLTTYLEMERLRFDEFFMYTITVSDEVDVMDVCVPSLMLQPLVENAIWHGLLPSDKGKKIAISFELMHDELVCTVEDNGIGINAARRLQMVQRPLHQSVSLENLRRRIRIMNEKFDTNCRLEIIDLFEAGYAQCGTRAVLKINCITSHQSQ